MPVELKPEVEGEETVDASAVLKTAKENLQKLSDLISKSDDENDKSSIGEILSSLASLEESLGYSPDEEPKQEKPTGRLSMESGSKDTKPIF